MRKTTAVLAALAMMAAALVIGATPAQAAPYDHLGTAPVSGGAFYISNYWSDECIDVENGSSTNGTHVQQYSCYVAWNQQFVLVYLGYVNNRQAWRIKPRFDQTKCVDVTDGVTQVGKPLQIWTCSSGWQQMFELHDVGSSSLHVYQIKPIYNGWCIGSTATYDDLARLIEEPCGSDGESGRSQEWALSY